MEQDNNKIHRDHNVLICSNIVGNIEVDDLSKMSAKNCIFKNWKTLHRPLSTPCVRGPRDKFGPGGTKKIVAKLS